MGRRRAQGILVVAALMLVTVLGALWVPEGAPPTPPAATIAPPKPTAPASPGATPIVAIDDLYHAIVPDQRQGIAAATASHVPRYTISGRLVPPASDGDAPTVTGTVEVRYVNTTGAPVDALPFRLNPNLRQYETGRMAIADVTVDGVAVAPRAPALHAVPAGTSVATPAVADADLILAWVPLPSSVAAGDAVTVAMTFSTTIPVDPPDETGLFRYHPDGGSWTLGHWYPMLAGYGPDTGWDTEPPAAWSDITFGAAALYDVTLTAPENLVLVTPGVETRSEHGNATTTTSFVSGPARDFPIIADPALVTSETTVGDTAITSYHHEEQADGANVILGWAAAALETYNDLFGAYPYTTLDIVAVPGLLGYEYPEMLMIGADFYADPENAGSRPGAVEFLIAHEVAHQWWYGLVGNSPHQHAFLDEGLAEYSAALYFERRYGAEVASEQLYQGLTLRYASLLVGAGDQVVDQPSAAFADLAAYYATVYRKAGLGFAAIRQVVGDDAFFAALRTYADTLRFAVAAPDDLLDVFQSASGDDLSDAWHLWFETASGRVRIIMAPDGGTPVAAPPG